MTDLYGRRETPVLTVSVCHYWAGPGRARDAALAWAFDMKHWMKRGVGEQPDVITHPAVLTYRAGGDLYRKDRGGWYALCGDGPALYLQFWPAGGKHAFLTWELTIYQVRGLITTTHPGDTEGECAWDPGSAWCLDYSLEPGRQEILRQPGASPRWDGT